MKTEQEMRHAITRYEDSRDGLARMGLPAHAMIADASAQALRWVLGEKDTKFGRILEQMDKQIAATMARAKATLN